VPSYVRQVTVLRVVLANPLTTDAILETVLAEQCTIVLQEDIQALLSQVEKICASVDEPPMACIL
jgi:glutamate decarboxylase